MGAEVLTYIGSDNFEGGAVAAVRYLAVALGGVGEVAIIEGISGHETADQRRLGFLDGIADHPGILVVASQTANWESLAYNVAENLLQAHPGLDAVFAANDEMALGALEAIAAAQRLDDVAVIGFDAIPDALENIRAGRLLGSVAQFSGEMGRLGVFHAVELLKEWAPCRRSRC